MRHTEPGRWVRAAPPDGVLRTARSIAAAQRADGAIGWPDGHVDPWDHVECAMALSACGLAGPARRAYRWLRDTQRPDGSWPAGSWLLAGTGRLWCGACRGACCVWLMSLSNAGRV